MAKTKTKHSKSAKTITKSPEELYNSAIESVDQLDYPSALIHATELLTLVDPDLASGKSTRPKPSATPALKLLGEIHIELGDEAAARRHFALSISGGPQSTLQPTDEAQVHFWLAQLSPDGGFDSVSHFERGVALLQAWLQQTEAERPPAEGREALLRAAARQQVASALCSVAEIFMTDLSWEEDAEERCERLVTEALLFAPEEPAVLQTLASVRLSQVKVDEARSALERSMRVWKDLDPDDDAVPDFATRVSLARLLMEAEMESEAMVVLERLALEDDTSVEACYLGGWCLHLMAQKVQGADATGKALEDDDDAETLKQASWKWLQNTVGLYDLQQYEDINLRSHVDELLESMEKDPDFTPAEATEVNEEWVDEEGESEEGDGEGEDEEMEDA